MKVGSSPAVLGGGADGDGGGSDGVVHVSPEYVNGSPQTDGIWETNIAWMGILLQSLNPAAPVNIICAAPRHMQSVWCVCPGCAVGGGSPSEAQAHPRVGDLANFPRVERLIVDCRLVEHILRRATAHALSLGRVPGL